MSKKDEVICSSNKYLRKLVNVYIMLFIQKKKKTEKKLKKNKEKAYYTYHYSLGYYLK